MPSSVTPLPSSPDCHTHTQYLDHSQSISTLYHIRHIRHTYLEGVVLSGKWVVDKETRHLRNPVSEWRESISTSVNIDKLSGEKTFQKLRNSQVYSFKVFLLYIHMYARFDCEVLHSKVAIYYIYSYVR